MKNGKRPTRQQCHTMKSYGLKPENWLVVKNLPDTLHLVHRYAGCTKEVPNG